MEYNGGYFLVLADHERTSFYKYMFDACGFNTEEIISIGEEIVKIFPNIYEIWKAKNAPNLSPSLSERLLSKVLPPNTFAELETAIDAQMEVRKQGYQSYVIGISIEDTFLSDFNLERDHRNDENGNPEGVFICLANKKTNEPCGQVIGYDISGYNLGGTFISYPMNDLLSNYLSRYPELHVNKYGLIDNKRDAVNIAAYTNDFLIEKVGAEEVLWLPWKITLYDKV